MIPPVTAVLLGEPHGYFIGFTSPGGAGQQGRGGTPARVSYAELLDSVNRFGNALAGFATWAAQSRIFVGSEGPSGPTRIPRLCRQVVSFSSSFNIEMFGAILSTLVGRTNHP